MRILARVLAWLALVALAMALPFLVRYLPTTNEGAASRFRDEWSGVLRLWVCDEMWQPGGGSFIPWLNACISRFERRNPGVYVQASSVPLSVLREFAQSPVNPPDMLLLAPGMLGAAEGLLPLAPNAALREPLQGAGQGYATAVALGGYGWALNAARLVEAPTDWAALGEVEKPRTAKRNQREFSWMDVPADAPFSSYSKAFLSLMVDRMVPDQPPEPVKAGEGLNLGLAETPGPTPTPQPMKQVHSTLPESLPADFRARESVLTDFASDRTAAILVSQREMKRLEVLSGAGRAPEWMLEPAPYTDQLAFVAVVNLPREDLAQRQALCVKLIDHLLSDDSQKALLGIRAFRAAPGDALYPYQTGFAQLERALSGGPVLLSAAFDPDFRDAARKAADDLVMRSAGT